MIFIMIIIELLLKLITKITVIILKFSLPIHPLYLYRNNLVVVLVI